MKRRRATMRKTTSQDDTDTDNEGTDNNNNNNSGDQGTNTNGEDFDKEDNHHKTMTGTETEMYNNNHTTKTVAAVHDEGDDEHGAEQKAQAMDTAPYDEERKKGPKRCCRHLLGRR